MGAEPLVGLVEADEEARAGPAISSVTRAKLTAGRELCENLAQLNLVLQPVLVIVLQPEQTALAPLVDLLSPHLSLFGLRITSWRTFPFLSDRRSCRPFERGLKAFSSTFTAEKQSNEG